MILSLVSSKDGRKQIAFNEQKLELHDCDVETVSAFEKCVF